MANWQQPFLAFPALKAEAAEVKHCLRPLFEVWRLHYMSPDSQEDTEVLLLLQRAAEMDELPRSGSRPSRAPSPRQPAASSTSP